MTEFNAPATLRLDRQNQKRPDGLSSSLQIAKAGEHLVCCELLLQGWNSFLADAGLPYDLLVDAGAGKFWRVQVKATCAMMKDGPRKYGGRSYRARAFYRFALRRSRTGNRRVSLECADVLAVAALDIRKVGFVPVSFVTRPDGLAVTAVEMKTRLFKYTKPRSGCDPSKCGRFIEDYAVFDPSATDPFAARRHHA